jgi:threonine dehydrogenase-like Zn-dependent dehydrogenase
MKALFCRNGTLSIEDCPKPVRQKGETLIRVGRAGICSTDIEIVKGYIPGFCGIPGHEFYGYIEEADDAALKGKRATAEINCACAKCDWCKKGLQRHCPHRTVLGIAKRNGAFAEFIAVPHQNVTVIPDEIPEPSAVLIEPLAAALEIFEQIPVNKEHQVLLVGDGRLAQLIGCVFCANGILLTAVGKHAAKLGLLAERGVKTFLLDKFTPSPFDMVIEASGSPAGFDLALACVRPRGTIVLKSTYVENLRFNPSPIVVNEITLIGSRCGRFSEAIRFLKKFKPDLSFMISARYPFSQALRAFEKVKEKEALKVVLEMD